MVVEPATKELRKTLQAVSHVAELDGSRGFSTKRSEIDLFTSTKQMFPFASGADQLFIPRGLALVIWQVLQSAGYKIQERVVGRPLLPAMQLQNLSNFAVNDRIFLRFIANHTEGIVKLDPEKIQIPLLIAQTALAWPDAKIAVLASRADDANRVARELRHYLPDTVAHHAKRPLSCYSSDFAFNQRKHSKTRFPKDHHHICSQPSQVVVTSYDYTGNPPSYSDEYDIVFALDAREALGIHGRFALESCTQARIFGFLEQNAELSPRETALAAAHFGFAEVAVPRHGHYERDVCTIRFSITGGDRVMEADALNLKRTGIWRHGVRKRQIRQIARKLREKFAGKADWKDARGIVVLVENIEQMVSLAKRMPGWNLIPGPNVCLDGISAEEKAVFERGMDVAKADPVAAIVTLGGLAKVNLNEVSFVIRADGGLGIPVALSDKLIVHNNTLLGALRLFDFDDAHHRILAKRANDRFKAYAERGWLPKGINKQIAAAERFLRAQRRA
jgi:hypothetical protein